MTYMMFEVITGSGDCLWLATSSGVSPEYGLSLIPCLTNGQLLLSVVGEGHVMSNCQAV